MLSPTINQRLQSFFLEYKPLDFDKREIVLQAGEPSGSIYMIKEGYVRSYRITEAGEELTQLILSPGDLFPLGLGLYEISGDYYLESLTKLHLYRAPKEAFISFIRTQSEVFSELTMEVLSKFGNLLTRMEDLVVGRAYTRVASTLLICAQRFGIKAGDDVVVGLPLTHKDIGNLAGITRETTCLEMKKLEQKGLVTRNGRLLVIKDIERLKEESLQQSA